jgi:hypothetical protein
VRYVSWFGGWLGLLPQRRPDAGAVTRKAGVQRSATELSNDDLFYIAMLGPHV